MVDTKPETKANDSTAKKAADDHGDASLKLSLAANTPGDKSDKTKVTDAAAKPKELDVQHKTEEIFGRITVAKQNADALAELISSKKPMTEKLTVTGADGKSHETTVGERIKELKHTVNDAANQSVMISKAVDQTEVSRKLDAAIAAGNKDEVQNLKNLQNAPAFTKLIYAQLKGGGFTNEDTPVEFKADGKLKVDQKDLLDAMSLITEAGAASQDLRNHPLYLDAVNEVFPRLENGSQKVQLITGELQSAIELGAKGDKVKQEEALKAAVAQADNINVPAIAQMVKDPAFANRQSPEILKEMANTVVMAETARLQYAQFLAEQGRFGEAQVQTLRVKAECPDVMYNRGDDGQLHYNDNRYVNLAKLDKQLAASSTFDVNKLNTDMTNYRTQLQNLQGLSTDSSQETKDSLAAKGVNNTQVKGDLATISASMDGQLATQKKELTDTKQALDAQKTKLEADQKALADKPGLTSDATKIEAKRIADEIKMVDLQKGQIEEQLHYNTQNTQMVRMLEASYDLAREDRSAATAKLEEIAKGDPAFVAAHKEDLDKMKDAAKEPGWWDSWGKKACIIGAVVVGVAAGIWLGPGAIATGMAAGAATATALGVTGAVGTTMLATAGAVGGLTVLGLGAGTVAAGGTGLTRLVAENTGGVTRDREGNALYSQSIGRDMGDAFKVAANTAPLVALPGAAGALTKFATTGAEVTAVAESATMMSRLSSLSKVGATNLAFGTTFTLSQTAIEKISNPSAQVDWTGHGVNSFGGQVLLNSAFGMGGALGSGGRVGRIVESVVGAERVAPTFGAMWTVGITQAMSTKNDYDQVNELGAAYNGFQTSQSLFGPWGFTPNDVSKSPFQAGQTRANMQQLDQGQSYYNIKANQAGTLTGYNSVFDSAEKYAAERQGK